MSTKNQFQNFKTNSAYSWPVIILFLIFFFPVAIFLIYKRFSLDKTNMIKNSKVTKVIGFVLFAFAFIYVLMGLTGNLETTDETMNPLGAVLLMLFIFGGGGLWLLIISAEMKKTGELYKKYVRAVINQNNASVDNIAAAVGVTFEVAQKDLYKMLDAGFFQGAYMDESNRELILPKQASMSGSSIKNAQTKVVKCQSCGATNTVFIGRVTECQYCGSPLE